MQALIQKKKKKVMQIGKKRRIISCVRIEIQARYKIIVLIFEREREKKKHTLIAYIIQREEKRIEC